MRMRWATTDVSRSGRRSRGLSALQGSLLFGTLSRDLQKILWGWEFQGRL